MKQDNIVQETSIHAPSDAKPKTPYDLKTDKEFKIDYLKNLYNEAKGNQKKYLDKWKDCVDFYDGDQFRIKSSQPELNIVYQAVQWALTLLTDMNPSFQVIPADPTDYQFSKLLNKLIEAWWKDNGMTDIISKAILHSLIYDVAIIKVTWNEVDDEVEVINIKPEDLLVPDIEDIDSAPYVIHRVVKSVGNLKRLYPDKAKDIHADYTKQEMPENLKITDPPDRTYGVYSHHDEIQNMCDDRNLVEVFEVWSKDSTLEEYIEENKETGEQEVYSKEKYPKGKVTLWLPRQNIILDEYENPYLHGKFPFIKISNGVGLSGFYGNAEISRIIQVQKNLNNLLANIISILNKTCSPKLIADSSTGLTRDQLQDPTGDVYIAKEGTKDGIKYLQPPQIPQYVFNFYEILLNSLDRMLGMSELSQGRRAGGDPNSGVGINLLQESSYGRIRFKERSHNLSLNKLGSLVVSLMLQYYNKTRTVKVSNMNPEAMPDYIEFYFDNFEGVTTLNKTDVKYDKTKDDYVKDPSNSESLKKSEFDVIISSDVSSQIVKTRRKQELMFLLKSQIISPEIYINATDLPEKEKILKQLELKAEAQQQQQQGV